MAWNPTPKAKRIRLGAYDPTYYAAYYERNKERIKAKSAAYKKAHPDKVKKWHVGWRLNNLQKCRTANAAYKKNNQQKVKDAARRYYQENREQCLQRCKKYDQAHRQEKNKYRAAWRRRHPEYSRRQSARRRALKRGATIGDQRAIRRWEDSWRKKRIVRCYWCRRKVSPSDCHTDHIISIGRGPHSVENLCISCSACNLKKGDSAISEWNHGLQNPTFSF